MAAQLLNQTDAQGRKQGLWMESDEYGYTSKVHYKDDLEEGLWEHYYPDGTLWWRRHYLHGQWHGPCELYYEDGTFRARGHYLHGGKHGLWEDYWHDSTIWTRCHYRHGQRHGLWEDYYSDGTLWSRRQYHNGKVIKVDSEEALEGYNGLILLQGQQAWAEITDRIPVGSSNWGFYWMLVNLDLL
jgi:antitoxin component YwqK of YwqJK toxin-antitoxin module